MSAEIRNSEETQKLARLIKGIDFGMMTTLETNGRLSSRPMSHNGNVEFDGDVWFFTYGESHKAQAIESRPQVNVSFASPKDQTYVSLTGRAELIRDKAKMAELWDPSLKAWFPKGLDEPDIALLKINVETAEYWDAPASPIAHVIGFAKSLAGHPGNVGDHQKIEIA